MTAPRRRALSLGLSLLASGCVGFGAGRETTSVSDPVGPTPQNDSCPGGEHAVEDIVVTNRLDGETRVRIVVHESDGGAVVLRRSVLLASSGDEGSTVAFCDAFADETAYRITIDAEGEEFTHDYAGEYDDNRGLVVTVDSEGVEVFEVEH